MKIGAILGAILVPLWYWYAPGAKLPEPGAVGIMMALVLGGALGALSGIGFRNTKG